VHRRDIDHGLSTTGHRTVLRTPTDEPALERDTSCVTPGAVGQAGLVEVRHVTRSPTVAGSALAVGIIQCVRLG